MATLRQKKAAKLAMESIIESKPKTKGEILLAAGYSKEVSENPQKVWTAEGFQRELSKLGDDRYLAMLDAIATDDSDKRACLEAIKMIFQLKGRFETKIKLTANEERDKVFELAERIDKQGDSSSNTMETPSESAENIGINQ